jgi:hypothetical protein
MPFVFGLSNAWADISVDNHQQFFTNDGALHIVGEIQNQLDVPINQVDIHVTMYSGSEVVDTLSTNLLVNTIMPGMKGPFEIVVLRQDAKKVDNYSFETEYKVSQPKNQVIDITESEISRDNFGNLMITGMVVNRGEFTANAISVVATLYDEEGNVAAVLTSQTKPDYLRSNDEAFFLVSVTDKSQANMVADYSLIAESEEYAAVPEFPLGSILFLTGSVSAYVLLTKYTSMTVGNLVYASTR